MGAENPTNAMKRLEKINLKPKQEREVVRILFKVLMKSKYYNPFFSYLLQKLCIFYRHYRFTTQIAIWNQIKALNFHINLKKMIKRMTFVRAFVI